MLVEKNNEEEILLEISVFLTGFERFDLQRSGLIDTYYAYALNEYKVAGEIQIFQSFLDTMKGIIKKCGHSHEEVINAIKEIILPCDKFGALVNQIISMWNYGKWDGRIIKKEDIEILETGSGITS